MRVLLFQRIIKKSFVHSSIDHRFDNLESEKEIIVVEKSLEKVLNFESENLYEPGINANKAGRACATALIT